MKLSIKNIMIKLLFVSLVLIMLFLFRIKYINVSASQEVLEGLDELVVVSGSKEDLILDDYVLEDYDVNFNVSGIYKAIYSKDDISYKRKITVMNEEEIKNDGYSSLTSKYQFNINIEQYIDKVKVKNRYYFLYKNSERYYLSSCNPSGAIYTYELKIKENVVIRNIVYNDEDLYFMLVGTYYDGNDVDLCLVNLSMDGIIRHYYYYGGDRNDFYNGCFNDDDYLYLYGYSLSNDYLKSTYNDENSYLLKIKWKTKLIEEISNFEEYGNDEINNGLIINKTIYLVKTFYDNGANLIKIIKIDDEINEFDLPLIGPVSNCLIDYYQDNLYVSFRYTDLSNNIHQMIYCLKNNGELKLIDDELGKYFPSLLNVSDYGIILGYKDNNNYMNIKTINYDNQTLYEGEIVKDLFNIGDDIIIINDDIMVYELNTIQISSFFEYHKNFITDPLVLRGFSKINYDENKSNLSYDLDTFGKYQLKYYYDFNGYFLILNQSLIIPLETNLYDGGIYDITVPLIFNAKGLLNEQLINSNFLITNPGEYEIKLIGNNDSRIINFEIVDKTLDKSKIRQNVMDLKENDMTVEDDNIKCNSLNLDANVSTNDYQNRLWYLIIPVSSLGVIFSLYFLIGKRWL